MAEAGTSRIQLALNRANQGEAEAWNDLIAMTQDRLRLIARRMLLKFPRVRRMDGSDDVLQGALFRLNRALRAKVRPPSARDFICFATVCLRRECLDLARKYAKLPDFQPLDAIGTPAGGSSGKSSHLEAWGDLHKAIEDLPDELREVFDLRWYFGMQQKEAAEVLGVSLSTVKRRWHDARLAVLPVAQALLGKQPR